MASGEIHILPSDSTPEYLFCSDGRFKIKGRGLYKTETEAVGELINWIDEYLGDPAEITYVVIALEYLNSFSTTILVSMLRRLNMVLHHSKKLVIQWYYEEDDEDILERGEYISITFDIPVTFIPTNHITDR
jgi:hypothetical protein